MDGEADDCTNDYKSEDYVDDYKDDRGSQDRWKNGRPMTRNSRRSTHVCVCLQILLIRVAPNYTAVWCKGLSELSCAILESFNILVVV